MNGKWLTFNSPEEQPDYVSRFKVGDSVLTLVDQAEDIFPEGGYEIYPAGLVGEIVRIYGEKVSVRFDHPFWGHTVIYRDSEIAHNRWWRRILIYARIALANFVDVGR